MSNKVMLGTPLIEQARAPIIGESRGDAADSRSTNYRITLDERFEGSIGSGDSGDWVAINLTAGQDYVFMAGGRDGARGLVDPVLTLYDSSGRQVAFNDDSEQSSNLFPLIEYRATQTATYYVKVDGFESSTGRYFLDVATDEFSVDDAVVQLAEFGWGSTAPFAHDERPGDTFQVNFSRLSADGRTLAEYAMAEWGKVLGFTIQSVSSDAAADVIFYDQPSEVEAGEPIVNFSVSNTSAFAGPQSIDASGEVGYAFVYVGEGWLDRYGTTLDSYSYQTYIHEIGHALGLSHPGQYDGVGTYGVDNHFVNDTTQFSIMSYFDQDEIGASIAAPITPMVADIEAVRFLYDAENVAVESGDTVWGANSTVGGAQGIVMSFYFDGANSALVGGDNVAMTIVDTGGTDLLDLSTMVDRQRIDLAEEGISDIAGLTGNVVMARGTVIENVIGGSNVDEILGNDAANRLEGRGGHDRLIGQAGGDDLLGGSGNDWLIGGADEDYAGATGRQIYRIYEAMFERAPDSTGYDYWIDAITSGGSSINTVVNGFINSREFQNVYGTTTNSQFVTLLYNNVLDRAPDAAGLADWVGQLNGGQRSRAEVVLGFSESAEFINKTAVASEGYDISFGMVDYLDEVYRLYRATFDRNPDLPGMEFHAARLADGVPLNTVAQDFSGSQEFGIRYGTNTSNADFVTLLYANVLDRAPDSDGLDYWTGLLNRGARDRGEVLTGFSESQEFKNNTADDFEAFLITSSGGRGGDDTLRGGTGNDSLVGGLYSDEFVFGRNEGSDIVHDLEIWDQLTFDGFGFSSDASARAAMVQDGDDVVFSAGGTTVRIANFNLNDMTDDIIFVT
ncbi:MAG: DUF4214 domain-containing protein [Pseudomonadota bacterium]